MAKKVSKTNAKSARSNKTSRSSRSNKSNKTNKRASSNNSKNMDSMKYEIANELGITLGGESSARANGRVGGQITKRLCERGARSNSSRSSR
jgi:Small, acid-soluble spore proteins, alpha/beta type.